MDYENFINDYKTFKPFEDWLANDGIKGAEGNDYIVFGDDRVNSPSHYRAGSQEAIDIIEDAVRHAPNPVEGMLQAQVLKYILRLWHKDNSTEDARKARWYLDRLISKLAD